MCTTSLLQNFNIIKPNLKRVFLHDVMVTRLVFQNNEMVAMLVSQTNPVGVLNSFFMKTLSFVPIKLHRCWPRDCKHSILAFSIKSTMHGYLNKHVFNGPL